MTYLSLSEKIDLVKREIKRQDPSVHLVVITDTFDKKTFSVTFDVNINGKLLPKVLSEQIFFDIKHNNGSYVSNLAYVLLCEWYRLIKI